MNTFMTIVLVSTIQKVSHGGIYTQTERCFLGGAPKKWRNLQFSSFKCHWYVCVNNVIKLLINYNIYGSKPKQHQKIIKLRNQSKSFPKHCEETYACRVCYKVNRCETVSQYIGSQKLSGLRAGTIRQMPWVWVPVETWLFTTCYIWHTAFKTHCHSPGICFMSYPVLVESMDVFL